MRSLSYLILAALAACSPMHYVHGVPNLAQVDANVYRSGQITTDEGWRYIEQLAAGRRVHVIKLNFDAEGSDAGALARGFVVDYWPIQPEGDQGLWCDWNAIFTLPDELSVLAVETMLSFAPWQTDTDFYLVHCTHGQDRTGLVIGEYRVLTDGWSKDRAYDEMLAHNFHPELWGLVRAWRRFAS